MPEIRSGQVYKLVNAKSGTVLDLSGTNNTDIIGWNDHGGPNQKWRVERAEGNGWTFRNVGSGRYLGRNKTHDGSSLRAVDDPVAWDIRPDEGDSQVFRIFAYGTIFNVDLSDHGNPENGTPVNLWTKWYPGTNQTWRFEEVY